MSYPTGAKEDPRFNKAVFDFPAMTKEVCQNCGLPLEEGEECYYHSYAGSFKVTRVICEDCIQDLPVLGRRVCEMTGDLKHDHNKRLYDRVYDRINFK